MNIFGFNIQRNRPMTTQVDIRDDNTFKGEKFNYLGTRPNENYNEPLVTEVYNSQYIYFGESNEYPNILNELYYSSPFHSSIINFKSLNLIGGGYDVIEDEGITEKQRIETKQMLSTFNDTFLKIMSMDFLIHSRLCWKIFWNADHTKIVHIERIDPAWVRSTKKVGGKVKEYVINRDWTGKLDRGSKTYTKIPAYDTFAKDEKEQLFVWQSFSPGLEYYCQPTYANASNWIYLDGQISYYHKSNIENSVNPSVAVKIYERPGNQEEEQNFIRNLKNSFTGAKNSGKVMVFFSNGKDLAPDIQSIESNTLDKAFSITQEMIIKNIAFSHTIDPVLMGISTPGALGQSQQLESAYTIFANTFIRPGQYTLDKILNYFMDQNNLGSKIKLKEFTLI